MGNNPQGLRRRHYGMSFRFWRRIKIAPGVTLNLSKSGGSLSLGPRGAKFTVGSRGKRALSYEELGEKSRARGEFEKFYAEEPDYEDVADRLGL